MMKRSNFNTIKCAICGNSFLRITNTHLWKQHQMTMQEYKEKFPNEPIDAPQLASSRVAHMRNKTYEEQYRNEKGSELKQIRSVAALNQMKEQAQIDIRKEKCGYEHSTEQKIRNSEAHTQHGGFSYRKKALEYYGLECGRCGFNSDDSDNFIVHHDDLNAFPSELGNHDIDNLTVLCRPCHANIHNQIKGLITGFVGMPSIEKGVHYIFKGLKEMGLNLNDPNFTDTPKRVARAYMEIFKGIGETEIKVKEILKTAFPSNYDQMIIGKDIIAYSMCPHHLLPVEYKVHVGYIPSENGQVIGISKLSRIVDLFARRPVLQEQFVEDVTSALMSIKGVRGAGCVAYGRHFCMIMRGVKQSNSETITSSVKGVFLDDLDTRMEWVRVSNTGWNL